MSDTDTITIGEVIDADLDLGIYVLAERAEVRSPDTKESPGAKFLDRVQMSANEFDAEPLLRSILAFVEAGDDADDYGVNDLPDDVRDSMSESADSDVQIYTYQCWQEFTDLCMWEEDLSEFGPGEGSDLTRDVAMRAQYIVAERLLGVLLAERAQAILRATLAPYLALGQDEEEALLLLAHDLDEDLHAFAPSTPGQGEEWQCSDCGDTAEGLMHSNTYRSAEPLAEAGE